jgi:signal transduction histidine kinase
MRAYRLALILAFATLTASSGSGLLADPPKAKASSEASQETQFAQFDAAIEKTKSAMMGDPQAALATARNAVQLADRLPLSGRATIARATAKWLEGEALLGTNDSHAAQPIIAEALALVERAAPNSKLHGDLLRSHGAIASMKGDVVAALNDYQRAFAVFQAAKITRSQAIVLQDLGQIYSDAGDYPKALRYYNQALETHVADPALNLSSHNNLAEVYRKQHAYDLATGEYRLALIEARKLGSPLLQVRILTNLAGAETEAGRLNEAQAAVEQALSMARNGEGAGWRPFVIGAEAKIAAQRGDLNRAAALFNTTFAGVDLGSSDMLFRDYHLSASKVHEGLGNQNLALAHFKAFQRLDSEARNLTSSIASQLASAQFDFANQNLRIARLKQEKLQKDIAARTTLFSVLGAAGMIVFVVLLYGFVSVRRSRNTVRAANDNLTVSNAALEKALHAKTEFLAMTSHEIRTPLNGILGMTQILLSDRRVADDLRNRIEVVNSAGETMRALVDDILDVAKMESGELTIVAEKTNLLAILKETGQLWSGQAETKGLDLRLETSEAPADIIGDGSRIRQIVFNLMSNALKFTLEGSVTLKVYAQATDDNAEQLLIEVIDTGIGIAPDMHEAIFESFKQVDAGTTRQFSGTGLGLAICKRLAEAMGGTIGVESAPGAGSTFRVSLPLTRLSGDLDPASHASDEGALSDKAMLVALPDGDAAVLIKMALMAEAESLEIATNLSDAAAMVGQGHCDHLLFDAACIAEDCADPLADLRGLVAACDAAGTKCSLLVAMDGPLSPAQAMMAGASQIIVKPIGIDELLPALRSVYAKEPEVFVAPVLMAGSK